MATHNGERFLAAQLASLLAQDHRSFKILASDDHSTDGTDAILATFAAAHPGLLRQLDPCPDRLGASGNFARLLDAATADYVMFCDQDDVWLSNKISASLALMAATEALASAATPILVHSDLAVVDANLNELDRSFMAYAGIDPRRNRFGALLLGNVATGCTVLVNRALYQLARPIPPEIPMFDHWLAQVAAGLGRIAYLDQPTVQYRQHGANAIGARKAGGASFLARVRRTLFSDDVLGVLLRYCQTASVHVERFGKQLGTGDARQANALAKVWTQPRYWRFVSLIQTGLRKPSLATTLGLFVLLLRQGDPDQSGQGGSRHQHG